MNVVFFKFKLLVVKHTFTKVLLDTSCVQLHWTNDVRGKAIHKYFN